MIVEAAPAVSRPRRSDRNIAIVAEDGADIYKPSRHVDLIRDSFERQGKEPEACPLPPAAPGGAAPRRSYGTISASPTISSSEAWPMTSAKAATACGSLPFRPSTSNRRSAATARPDLTRSLLPALQCRRLVETGHPKFEADGSLSPTKSRGHAGAPGGRAGGAGDHISARSHLPSGQARRPYQWHARRLGQSRQRAPRHDCGLGFSPVSWQLALDQRITGVVRGAGIEWNFGETSGWEP